MKRHVPRSAFAVDRDGFRRTGVIVVTDYVGETDVSTIILLRLVHLDTNVHDLIHSPHVAISTGNIRRANVSSMRVDVDRFGDRALEVEILEDDVADGAISVKMFTIGLADISTCGNSGERDAFPHETTPLDHD